MKKSFIAENIMTEYKKEKRMEKNQRFTELNKFIKENCTNCKNKKTDLCKIVRNIDGKLNCVFKEE